MIDEKFFDQIDKAILITNADIEPWNPLIVYVNPAFCKMSGYKKEEILGKTPKIFQGALSDKAILSHLKEGLLTSGRFEASTVNYKKNGSMYWVEWTISSIFDENGKLQYFFSVQQDITDKKELEILASQKTNRQEQEHILVMLQQAKMAELGGVLSAIMHQWMQPLNTLSLIVGNISLGLKECGASEKIDKLAKDAKSQIQFMTQTMYDFRNFFRPSDKSDIFCPCVLLKKLYFMFEGLFLENGIEVQIGNEHRCKHVNGHQSEYIQVLLNILKNAADALIDRAVEHKKIVCLIDDSLRGFVRIIIRDNAGGIEPFLLPNRIFEPFVTTKGAEGTGIGLYISKNIVENRFGGRLRVHNTQEGAEFWIDIVSIEEQGYS